MDCRPGKPSAALSVAACFALVSATTPAALASSSGITVLTTTGEAAPDGIGNLWGIRRPVMSNNGDVVFQAASGPCCDQGIIVRFESSSGTLSVVAREGDLGPDGLHELPSPYDSATPAVNDAGVIAFSSGHVGGGNPKTYRYTPLSDELVELYRDGDPSPDGDGFHWGTAPSDMNANGVVAFWDQLSGTDGGFSDNEGVFTSSGAKRFVIARSGDPSPDGVDTMNNLFAPVINDSGQIAFRVENSGSAYSTDLICLADDNGLEVIARKGWPGPGGSIISDINTPSLNSPGQVAFSVSSGLGSSYSAVLRVDDDVMHELVKSGQLIPDGLTTFRSFSGTVPMNDLGQVSITARLNGYVTNAPPKGIFRADTDTVTQIARHPDPTPRGDAIFDYFTHEFAINNNGQVVFHCNVNTGNNTRGIYFFDDKTGLQTVARLGDELLGSTISDFEFVGGRAPNRTSFSDTGRLAFWFRLADDRRGVAIWSPSDVIIPGDLTGDGVVDGADLALLLGAWGPCDDCDTPADCPADLDGNCTVDGADLAILLGNWS